MQQGLTIRYKTPLERESPRKVATREASPVKKQCFETKELAYRRCIDKDKPVWVNAIAAEKPMLHKINLRKLVV